MIYQKPRCHAWTEERFFQTGDLFLSLKHASLEYLPLFSFRIRLISLPLSFLKSSKAVLLGGGVREASDGIGELDFSCTSDLPPPACDFWPALSLSLLLRLLVRFPPTSAVTFGLTLPPAMPTPNPLGSTSPTRPDSPSYVVPSFAVPAEI